MTDPNEDPGDPMRRHYLILLLAVLAACSATNHRTTSRSNEPTRTEKPAIAEKLATLDGANAGNPAYYDVALGQLSRRCDDHPEHIADMAVASRDKLAQIGISDSLLNILLNVNNAVSQGDNLNQGVRDGLRRVRLLPSQYSVGGARGRQPPTG